MFMKLLGKYEIQPTHDGYKIFQELVCEENSITEPLCSNILFLIAGFDSDQYNKVQNCRFFTLKSILFYIYIHIYIIIYILCFLT